MLSGATCNAAAIVGTAVFKIVVSRDSMKNATATSHGNSRALAALSSAEASPAAMFWEMLIVERCAATPGEKLLASYRSYVDKSWCAGYKSRKSLTNRP